MTLGKKGKIGIIVAAIIVVLAIIFIPSSLKIVKTGYTGVRVTFGQVDDVVVPSGVNWKLPFVQKIVMVNNKVQDKNFEDETSSETAERTAIYFDDVTVTYQISSEKSAWLVSNVKDYNSLVTMDLVSSAIKTASKTLSDVDATNRAIVEPLVKDALQSGLDEKYGEGLVSVSKVTITNVDFEASYNQSIANKQQAQIESEQQAIVNQKNIDQANAEAEVALINAQANADAAVIEAQGEADANALLNASLTSKILEQNYIDKWDGELPSVLTDSGSNLILGLQDSIGGSTTTNSEG